MKHCFLLPIAVVFLVLGFISCETREYSVTVNNNSSKPVTYTYNDITDTLSISESKEYQVKAYTQPPKNISVPGALSVQVENLKSGEEYVFTNASPLDLHVLNTLDISVVLVADKYIDAGDESTELIIPARMENKTSKIYSRKPKFTILSEYSPTVVWEIEGNIMIVTIK
jgi:hypothetical protein